MKYKGIGQKKAYLFFNRWIKVLAGVMLAGLPFVVSFVGWDTFRLPKDSFFVLATAFLVVLLLAFKKMSISIQISGWEWVFLGGLAYTGFHILVSSSRVLSWGGFISLFVFALLFWVLRSISTIRFQQAVWLWIGAALGINGVLTVFQYYGMLDWMRSSTGQVIHGRINPAGFIGEVNSGGFLFGLAIVVLVFYVATRQPPFIRVLAGVLIGLNLLGLAFSRGLTASVGLVSCLMVWLVFHQWWVIRRKKGGSRELIVFWVVFLAILLGGLGLAYKAGLTQRVFRVIAASQQGHWSLATAGRIPVYWLTWQMIKEKPLLGRGLNTFGRDFFYFRAETEAGQSVNLLHQSGAFREVHNEYLQAWEELGLPGLLILLALIFLPIIVSLGRLRRLEDENEVYWLGTLTLGVLFVAISCLAFFPLHLSVTGVYIAFLIAGLRVIQEPSPAEAFQRGGLFRPVVVGTLLIVAAGLAWKAVDDWRANEEAGIAAFLLQNAASPDYRPAQKRVIADEALTRLERAERLSPDFHEIYNLKGSVLMMLGRYELAVESYSRGVKVNPSPELYTNLAAAYMAIEKRQKARECIDLALGYAPEYTKAREALNFLEKGR